MDTGALLSEFLISQAQAAEAGSIWIDYIVYGGLISFLVVFLYKALKQPAPALEDRRRPGPSMPEGPKKSEEELEAEARKAFKIPHVDAGGGGRTRVRLAAAEDAPAPTEDASIKDKPAEEAAPEAAPEVEPEAKPAEAPADKPEEPSTEEAGKTLREGLSRTHEGFVKKLTKLFGGAQTIDDDLLAELEEALFTADIGVQTSLKLVEEVESSMSSGLSDPAKVWAKLKQQIHEMLQVDAEPLDLGRANPFIIMVVGVNGAGKTTTIGKLARQYMDQGKRVILAAGDTFRAAAVEQLEVWGERAGVPVVRGKEGQDPSSVIFEACERARNEGFDVCIADTAGRLQAKKELMDELAKVHRVIGKAAPGGPHEVWLVLDSTNGQNAISQAKEFTKVVNVTGLVLTKLDGTAKGGVVIGISDEMNLPVRYIGIGEKVEDLREFDPVAFTEALFGEE